MRALFALLALAVLAWGVFVFLPKSEVGAEEGGSDPTLDGSRFLSRPEGAPPGVPAPAPDPVPAQTDPAGAEPAPAALTAFGVSLDPGAGPELDVDQGTLLAQAVLFGGPMDVERVLGGLGEVPDATRRMALSFAEALAGKRRAALQLAQGLDEPGVLADEDRRLLKAALGAEGGAGVRPAGASSESALRAAMRLRLVERDANQRLAAGEYAAAAEGFSELLIAGLTGPWEATRGSLVAWTQGVMAAQDQHRWNPRGQWPAVEVQVAPGQNLTVIRRDYLADHPGRLLCTGQVEKANRIVGYLQENQTLRIPTDRASVLVDLSSRWLLYLMGGEVAAAWEVGIGRQGEETILGDFVAAEKQKEPTWWPKGQEPQYFPDNPLGTRWIAWFRNGEKTGYGIHGTWEDDSIGQAASDGCIRMHNQDVEVLFSILPVGATVRVQG